MKKLLLACLSVITVLTGYAQIDNPAKLYPGLFEDVQMQRVYPDGKTFVDATPRQPVKVIVKAYQQAKQQPGFNLKAFTQRYFKAPAQNSSPYRSQVQAGIYKHLDTLWTVLQHVADTAKGTTLIPLPHDYVVPGGRFREIYYWDSYFTMLGLEEAGRYSLIENMVKNFAYLIDHYGHIPNGNRTYYLSRSQPPFFALMVQLLARHKGQQVLAVYRPQLLKEYQCWMQGSSQLKNNQAYAHVVKLNNGSLLNRYWDASTRPREESYREDVLAGRQTKQARPGFYRNIRAAAESGWDFSSRWMADGRSLATLQTTSLVPVDLNCLLYTLEQSIAQSYQIMGNAAAAKPYTVQAARRKAAILQYCWNAKAGCFTDYNWQQKTLSNQLTIATAFPLFTGIASPVQARQIAAIIKKRFLRAGGVATTLINTGQQWDRPNGWAPLQYITIAGLRRYRENQLAQTIAHRWIALNTATFKQSGKLVEKYDIEHAHARAGGGEYPLQDGFGWTNGVLLKLMNLYKASY